MGETHGHQPNARVHGRGEVRAHNEHRIGSAALLTGAFMVAEGRGGLARIVDVHHSDRIAAAIKAVLQKRYGVHLF